jgi:hypothetical protein
MEIKCDFDSNYCYATTRVNRVGGFLSSGRLLTFYIKIPRQPITCVHNYSTEIVFCFNFDKKSFGLHFGRFFHKLVTLATTEFYYMCTCRRSVAGRCATRCIRQAEVNFINLKFGRTDLGLVIILKFWTQFHQKF